MDEKIDKAIEVLLNKFTGGTVPGPPESQTYSQAILNLAHAKETLQGKSKPPK